MLCFAKVIVKNDYEKKGDLVFRPLLRAYKKINANVLMKNGHAIIIGMVDKDGIFHEMFTGNEFYCDFYKEMDIGDVYEIKTKLTNEDVENIRNVINEVIFKKKVSIAKDDKIVYEGINAPDYEDEKIRIQEDDEDLRVELKGYQNDLSLFDPLDKDNVNGYKNFLYKVSKLNELQLNKSK